jgi:hypothetical protein
MSTLLEIRRSDLARHQVATSCSAMFRLPSHSQLQAASHCSANAYKSLTTQGAKKKAQSPIESRSMPARNLRRIHAGNTSASKLTRASSNTDQHKPNDALNRHRSRSRIGPIRPRLRALALRGCLLLVPVAVVVTQASGKPSQQQAHTPQQCVVIRSPHRRGRAVPAAL